MADKEIVLHCKKVVGGINQGKALIFNTTLSFWGEFDPFTGKITAVNHPFFNQTVQDRVIIMKSTKGSSGTPEAITLACREGKGPAAFIVEEIDSLLVLACVINHIPLVTDFDVDLFKRIKNGDLVKVDGEDGVIKVVRSTELNRSSARSDAKKNGKFM